MECSKHSWPESTKRLSATLLTLSMASPGPTSQVPAAQLVHDSDSKIMDGSEQASPIQVKDEHNMVVLTQLGRNDTQQFVTGVGQVHESDAQRAEIASFLQSCAGQEMMRALESRHEEKLTEVKKNAEKFRLVCQQARAQQALVPVPPVPDLPEPTGPPTTLHAPPSVVQPSTTIGECPNSSAVQEFWAYPKGRAAAFEERLHLQPAAVRARPLKAGQTVGLADESPARRVTRERQATLVRPTMGHNSCANGERYGITSETNFWCKTCEKKILAVRRRGELVGVPIYVLQNPCDGTANPPKEVNSKKVDADKIATPPYPWLTAIEDQKNPVPIMPGRPKTTFEAPTAKSFEHLGARVGSLDTLTNLVQTGQHSGILEVEPRAPSNTPGASSSSSGPTPPQAAPNAEYLQDVIRRLQTAGITLQDLQGIMRSQ